VTQSYRVQILAPPDNHPSDAFNGARIDEEAYSQQLASLQSLRGRVYLQDRAIQPWDVDANGRFPMPGDDLSWHFLLTDAEQEVIGCVRYLVHPQTVSFNNLLIAHSAMASNAEWHDKVREAIEADLRMALDEHLSYIEIGGLALAEAWRGTSAALEILVASYALGHLWGGCLGSCTATVRHSSSSILRRVGGARFQIGGEALPPYEDPTYGCEMELLRFDSRSPAQRFIPLISQVETKLANTVAMVCSSREDFRSAIVSLSEEQMFDRSLSSIPTQLGLKHDEETNTIPEMA
jgi:hypothetical protein